MLHRIVMVTAGAALALLLGARCTAQDARTVTEPDFPSGCQTLAASLYISSGEPNSETNFDTSRITSALNTSACVELITAGNDNAFLIQPITIPQGKILLVDGGVTVFASRNPADYQVSGAADTCGTTTGSGGGCKPLITIAKNTSTSAAGSAIMGYGIIDARGGDHLVVGGVVQTYSWWDNAANGGGNQSNPVMIQATQADSFILYKITLRNSPKMHVIYKDGTGFTVWDAKVVTPHDADNTDGIDPTGSNNITITNSYISDGDDDVAIGSSSASYPGHNITVSHDHIYGGHGVSIGSITNGGIANVLVEHVNFAGTVGDNFATGLRIKSAEDRGGTIEGIVYQNICEQNLRYPLQLNPFYDSGTGTEYPYFKSVALHNVNVLNLPSNTKVALQGFNATYPTGLTLDNVTFPNTLTAAMLNPAPQFINVQLGPGPVTPALLQTLTGTGISETNGITDSSEAPYDCSSAFVYLAGELYLSDTTLTNQRTLTETAPATFTLNVMLQPAVANSAAPTSGINILEGSTIVGTANLGGNGTIASLTLSGVSAGSHTYTAQYPGDSNYAAITFGSVTVTVVAPDYSLVVTPASVVTSGSGSTTTLVSLAPLDLFSGVVSLSCSGLPSLMTCNFDPVSLQLQPNSSVLNSKLTFKTGLQSAASLSTQSRIGFIDLCGPLSLGGLIFAGLFRRRGLRGLALTVVACVFTFGLSACGTKPLAVQQNAQPGSTSVKVIATSGTISHETTVIITVQ
ncbi:MAG: glycosyl hydrolase family 28 protein [Acidobacteriaceae bacterium]|nr:glycosyl hydrolase family 28 protein [Acidobacteriaceae bacterium]